MSPQNVIVGSDGIARVLDFGVAKAASRLQSTLEGQLKGKVSYMAPEQVSGQATRQSDIYAVGVVMWEALAMRRLFTGSNDAQLLHAVLSPKVLPPSTHNSEVSPELDRIVLKALSPQPALRFTTAREMAEALDACARPASSNQVAQWLESMAGAALQARTRLVAECESHSGNTGRSEVKKLLDMGLAAMLPGDSGPQGPLRLPVSTSGVSQSSQLLEAQPGTGSSLRSAAVSLKPEPPSASRSWLLVLGGALLAGAVGGAILLVERASSHTVTAAPAETTVWVPPVPSPDPSPAATPLPPPTGEVAASSTVALPPQVTPEAPASAGVHAKKSAPQGSPSRPKSPPANPGAAPSDMNSLLDSH